MLAQSLRSYQITVEADDLYSILSEGYDKSSDSYIFPSGSFNSFSDVIIKENLFRRLGTVLHAPTREGLIQTVFSTANAAIADEATAFPEDNDTFDKASFSSYKIAAVSKLNSKRLITRCLLK